MLKYEKLCIVSTHQVTEAVLRSQHNLMLSKSIWQSDRLWMFVFVVVAAAAAAAAVVVPAQPHRCDLNQWSSLTSLNQTDWSRCPIHIPDRPCACRNCIELR